MDDFIPPETVPQLSRKRPRLDDQIEEYRKNAAKRHAEMFANTLAESADSAAVDVASMSDYEQQSRMQSYGEQQDILAEIDDDLRTRYDQSEADRTYPGALKALRREDLRRPLWFARSISREDGYRQGVASTHANPLTGVENHKMTLQNRRR